MVVTVDSIKEEEEKYIKLMKDEKKPEDMKAEKIEETAMQKVTASILRGFEKMMEGKVLIPDITKIKGEVDAKVVFPEIQKIKGSVVIENQIKLPETQKIEGTVDVKFPETQKVRGDVNAKVEFPNFSKIFTEALKAIKFPKAPEVQKIKGDVIAKVEFPETQKIVGSVKTNIPVQRGENVRPDEYVPVRLTTGKKFYDLMTQNISSNGRVAAVIQELVNKMDTQTTGNTPVYGQQTIAVTNTAIALTASTTPIKNGIIVQALSGNSGSVYIGGSGVTSSNGFELQAGQATSIAIENVSLIFVNGTAADKVCYIGVN